MSKAPTKSIGKAVAGAVRHAVGGSSTEWVRVRPYREGQAIPFVVSPAVDGLDLVTWARSNREYLDRLLGSHRALLFRGFHCDTAERFQAFVEATSRTGRLTYRDRTTPRTSKGDGIYTSTIHPADQRINLHNEGTYWTQWAFKIYFCSVKAAATGGETPIADVRHVHNRIAPGLRARFEQKGMMLVRNFNDGFGLPWQEVFQTDDAAEVEAYCRDNDIQLEWKDGGRLRTRQIRPAIRHHPVTGEAVWFNHAAFFHYTTLEPAVRDALLGEFGIEGLPYNTCYGDGSPIGDDEAAALREAYEAEKAMFPWEVGDIMLLDNMTVAHAREPYTGERETLAAMTEPVNGGGFLPHPPVGT
jgi:alpha-ketoglutarate-dependent taurine dioxygenase